MPNTHIILFDVFGDMKEVAKSDIKEIARAPQSELVLLADRYVLHNGDVWWTKGNRGWYDEHVLQSKESLVIVKGKNASHT